MATDNTITVNGDVKRTNRDPIIEGRPIFAVAPAGNNLYSVPGFDPDDLALVARATGNGVDTAFTLPAELDDLDNTTALAEATHLNTIVIVDGTILTPIDPAGVGSPVAGQFKVTDVDEITFGAAPASGAQIEVYNGKSAGITQETGGALTANRFYELTCAGFYHSANLVNLLPTR